MRRHIVVFLAALATPANAAEPTLPVPPIPPAQPPLPAAPMPNPNIVRPQDNEQRYSVTLDSAINHRDAPDPGFGFAPGSHYQLDSDRRWFVLPGVMVHVAVP
jgi:hypothetical protein